MEPRPKTKNQSMTYNDNHCN